MHEQRQAAGQLEDHEFSPAADGCDRSSLYLAAKGPGRRLGNRAGPKYSSRDNGGSGNTGGDQIVYDGLDFRQLGHVGVTAGLQLTFFDPSAYTILTAQQGIFSPFCGKDF
jgi:hypothetical protein